MSVHSTLSRSNRVFSLLACSQVKPPFCFLRFVFAFIRRGRNGSQRKEPALGFSNKIKGEIRKLKKLWDIRVEGCLNNGNTWLSPQIREKRGEIIWLTWIWRNFIWKREWKKKKNIYIWAFLRKWNNIFLEVEF